MATSRELKDENEASLRSQRNSRELNNARRGLRDEMKSSLSGIGNTEDKRNIKEYYEGAIYDLSTSYVPSSNKDDYESDIGERGIDQFTAPDATPETLIEDKLLGYYEAIRDYVDENNEAQQEYYWVKEAT